MADPPTLGTVLVVDDQESNRELLAAYLDTLPCVVRTAPDGETALALVAAEPPDLILLDVMMPGLDGYAVTERLKADPATAAIPVVLVTALSERADRVRGLEAGADEFLTKPVDEAELLARVRALLRLKRLQDEREESHARSLALAASQLASSEQRFRDLVDGLDAIVWEADAASLRHVFVSQRTEALLGYPASRWLDEPGLWTRLLHPADRERVLEARQAAVRDGRETPIEYRALAADGRVVWLRDTVQVVRDAAGRVRQLRGVAVDITARKEAEDALRESEARFRAMADSSPMMIWTTGPDARCDFVNRSWLAFTGRTLGEELGQGWAALIHPDDQARALGTFKAAFAARQPFEMEYRLRRHDGEYRWVCDLGAPRFGADGSFVGYVGSGIDLTERRRAEEALRAQREELRRIIDTTPNLIFVKDGEGRYTLANRAVAEIFGTTVANLLGKTDRDFNSNLEEVEHFLRQDRLAMESGQPLHLPEEPVTNLRTGEVRWFHTIKVPIVGPDGVARQVLGVAADITERRQAETALRESEEHLRQVQRLEAIGRLAGGVAHDFNNLLTAITGFSELLQLQMNPDHPLRAYVDEIKKAGDRAAGLTRQLLAFSRRQILAPEVLDLNAVVADVEKMLGRLIGEDIELVTDLDPDLGRVLADPSQVQQVLLNLVVNARDAMPRGGRLTITTANRFLDEAYARAHMPTEAGTYVKLAVSDTGHGMDEETQSRVFEPFFTTKEPGQGTGLGLSTVYGIVKQSGGYIWVESAPGQGATFEIYMPRIAAAVATPAAPATVSDMLGGRETILLVEDEEQVRGLAARALRALGYTVLEASHGEEALRAAARYTGPIHLLVTDVIMPGVGGRELALGLVAHHPTMAVLYMSGYTDDAIGRQGVLDPDTPFLQKPFTGTSLARKVREVLDARRAS
jgi:two-component system, cell cycle sensor histidine kinase and response regulator CckA